MADKPDFSGYYGSEKLSDCTVTLVEEPLPGSGSAKRKQQEVPGHSMVLVAFSGYCKAKLESWDSVNTADDGGQSERFVLRKRIEVPVPPGQLELGQLLLKGMYCQALQAPDAGLAQEQLLQLLRLADRYEVPKVAKEVAAAFAAIPMQQLQWDTVTAVYQLPAGCADLEACKPVLEAAANKLQEALGDLELIWSTSSSSSSVSGNGTSAAATTGIGAAAAAAAAAVDQGCSKQQLLLGLPFAAVKALLSDDRTCVASECTVFYTIERWYEQQQQLDSEQASQQQLKELLRLLRMQHCSQLGVLAMSHSSLARILFSWEELMIGCCLATTSTASIVAESQSPVLVKYPAWSAPKRSASCVKELSVVWELQLSELQEAVEEHFTELGETVWLASPTYAWKGQGFMLRLCVEPSSDGNGGMLGVYTALVPNLPSTVARRVSSAIFLLRLPGQQPGQTRAAVPEAQQNSTEDKVCSGSDIYTDDCGSWGRDIDCLGAFKSWQELQHALQQQSRVHPGGCMRLQLRVSSVT